MIQTFSTPFSGLSGLSPPSATGSEARHPGPRPVGLHLATALAILQTSFAALPLVKHGSPIWSASLRDSAASLAADLADRPLERLIPALLKEASRRYQLMLQGITQYRNHSYDRGLTPMPSVWTAGTTVLRDYGGDGLPVLFIPSLVNRAHVLDLSQRRSFLRWLAGQGLHPYLVEWNAPGPEERMFDLGDYVLKRLSPILDFLTGLHGTKLPVVGYCMGGDLAVAATLHRSDVVSALGALAVPWDFHAEGGEGRGRLLWASRDIITALIDGWGELPLDVLQSFFLGLDPSLSLKKFAAFAAMDQSSDAAQDFVALEDWLNDGTPLAAKVGRECLVDWYGANSIGRGNWVCGGRVINPAELACPLWLAVPSGDRIVPPESALALYRAAGQGIVYRPPLGHIGMMVGGKAERELWQPLSTWLKDTLPLAERLAASHMPTKSLNAKGGRRYGAGVRKTARKRKGGSTSSRRTTS